ncbi:hypothetical protein NC239_26695 [Streptomyces sp. G3]|uniref:hypothetical protein n=1 Tax=Streptomyces sp. G3 TaxID=690144 RepID=UPI00202DBE4A|nr:hypothetical protein [Streptomyces sp. G3]MCM1941792.1 hypothetical protein [Streptomyces sp. G3]
MTRLELPSTQQISAVLTDQELTVHARLIWTYLVVADQPQNGRSLAAALGMATNTVSGCMGVMRERGLVRRLNGTWIAQSLTPKEEGR